MMQRKRNYEEYLREVLDEMYEKTTWGRAVSIPAGKPVKKKREKTMPKKRFNGYTKLDIDVVSNGFTIKPKDTGHASKLYVFKTPKELEKFLDDNMAPIDKGE